MSDTKHDEEQALDDKYVDSFNCGYILAKHEPELFKLIAPSHDKDKSIASR